MVGTKNQPLEKEDNESKVIFRHPNENDGAAMFELVKKTKVLDLNSAYSYLMWGKYFNQSSIVAEVENRIVGFITGFIQPDSPNTFFVWQVGVDESQRGKGLATKMIRHLLHQENQKYVTFLEATVTPSNVASNNLFKGFAEKLGTKCEVSECFSKEQFPDPSYEKELTYRIGPF